MKSKSNNRGWQQPKSYTRGWRHPDTGEMNINHKVGNSKSASSTIMMHPSEKISILIHAAIGFVNMCDNPTNSRKAVYFRKRDLAEIANDRVGDHFDGNETVYVKSFDNFGNEM